MRIGPSTEQVRKCKRRRLTRLSPSQFPGLGALNRGFGGSHIDQVVYYLEQVLLKHQPRIVVFSCGGNDIATGKAPERASTGTLSNL